MKRIPVHERPRLLDQPAGFVNLLPRIRDSRVRQDAPHRHRSSRTISLDQPAPGVRNHKPSFTTFGLRLDDQAQWDQGAQRPDLGRDAVATSFPQQGDLGQAVARNALQHPKLNGR
jgi:hypothetical protein